MEEREKREKQKREAEEKKAKEEAQSKIPPNQWFMSDMYKNEFNSTFSKFDERGVPTHFIDEKNNEVPIGKGQSKKLEQAYAKQQKLHSAWLKKQAK